MACVTLHFGASCLKKSVVFLASLSHFVTMGNGRNIFANLDIEIYLEYLASAKTYQLFPETGRCRYRHLGYDSA